MRAASILFLVFLPALAGCADEEPSANPAAEAAPEPILDVIDLQARACVPDRCVLSASSSLGFHVLGDENITRTILVAVWWNATSPASTELTMGLFGTDEDQAWTGASPIEIALELPGQTDYSLNFRPAGDAPAEAQQTIEVTTLGNVRRGVRVDPV